MNNAVDRLEKDMTETKINELVARHYEAHALLQGKLTSELDTIKEAQRREYREWLMRMLEENQTNSSLPTPKYVYALTSASYSNNSNIRLNTFYKIK